MSHPDRYAVIFDCDGVLVDSEPLGLPALERTLLSFGFARSEFNLEHFCGRADTESIRELCESTGKQIDLKAYLARKMQNYLDEVASQGLQAFPGVPELLQSLREAGVALALASSGPIRKIQTNIDSAGLHGAFEAIVSAEEVERGKPAPDVFLEAARRIGVPPERCTVIEDAPAGLLAAKAAGMRAVAVAHTFPAHELAHLADEVVERIGLLDADTFFEACSLS